MLSLLGMQCSACKCISALVHHDSYDVSPLDLDSGNSDNSNSVSNLREVTGKNIKVFVIQNVMTVMAYCVLHVNTMFPCLCHQYYYLLDLSCDAPSVRGMKGTLWYNQRRY